MTTILFHRIIKNLILRKILGKIHIKTNKVYIFKVNILDNLQIMLFPSRATTNRKAVFIFQFV